MPFRHKILRIWMIYTLWAQSFVFKIFHFFCNFLHHPQTFLPTECVCNTCFQPGWLMPELSSSDSQNDERLGKRFDEARWLKPVIKFHVSSNNVSSTPHLSHDCQWWGKRQGADRPIWKGISGVGRHIETHQHLHIACETNCNKLAKRKPDTL